MNFKNSKHTSLLVLFALILVIGINWAGSYIYSKIDLTEGHIYTLSDGTLKVLNGLQSPVKIKFYFSKNNESMPMALKGFASRVDDLLEEFKSNSNGKVSIERLDPEPDTDIEDAASLAGIGAQSLSNGEHFYLGMVVEVGDQKTTIPAITLERERLLEYDIVKALSKSAQPSTVQVGIMSPLPVFGSSGMPMMGVPPTEKQVFVSELERDYKVTSVSADAQAIPADIKILIVLHPKNMSEATLFALDQFVMRGGKLIALLDPYAYFDIVQGPSGPAPGGTASNLDALTKSWGVTLDSSKILSDMQFMSGRGPQSMPTLLSLNTDAYNAEDIATAKLGSTLFAFSGALSLSDVPGLKSEVLIHSSKDSALVANKDGTLRGDQAIRNFKPSNLNFPLAVRLSGQFKTAFPQGSPVVSKASAADNSVGKPQSASSTASKSVLGASSKEAQSSVPETQEPQLMQTKSNNSLVVIADSDFINNEVAVEIQQIFGQKIVYPTNGNLAFLQALVDQYAGDDALISLRTRQSMTRPLTLINEMQVKAQQAYTGKIKDLEENLQKTKESLQALQKSKTDAQSAAILSKEQQAQIDQFKVQESQTRLELRNLRKNLRIESETLQFWVKMINIGLVPLLLFVLWGGLVFSRKRG
jgi:ABC-type uncharacterized transport system involved in gliding motility auxiliary subunit